MIKFEVLFFEEDNGKVPVEEFLDDLDKKMRAKLVGLIEILQESGNDLREPYSKYLGGNIFELRCKVGSDISRVLYFFYHGGRIIMTNGFIKKSMKTPRQEIDRAKKYRKIYIKRCKEDEKV